MLSAVERLPPEPKGGVNNGSGSLRLSSLVGDKENTFTVPYIKAIYFMYLKEFGVEPHDVFSMIEGYGFSLVLRG